MKRQVSTSVEPCRFSPLKPANVIWGDRIVAPPQKLKRIKSASPNGTHKMEFKKYKLKDLCSSISTRGHQIKQTEIISSGKNPVISQSDSFIEGYSNNEIALTIGPCVIFGDHTCIVKYVNFPFIIGADGVKVLQSSVCDPYYFYCIVKCLGELVSDGKYRRHFYDLNEKEISLPPLEEQKKIAGTLALIDRKIELCEAQNRTLEKLARQIYDYWFVQFDFPDENGRPYKSSGGKMVYNEKLKREIPEGWEVKSLEDFVRKNNTGDWGVDKATSKKNLKVSCIRGADISTLVGMPTRYIDSKNQEKLLSEWDVVIEISGGSPTQSTGRSALITAHCLARNDNRVTCSNFCHAVTLHNEKNAPYFFYTLDVLYKNGVMFGYEGKTSGLKNLMLDSFLKIYWMVPPDELRDLFFEQAKTCVAEIDANITQIQTLTSLRERLLPLLMNGQVEVRD